MNSMSVGGEILFNEPPTWTANDVSTLVHVDDIVWGDVNVLSSFPTATGPECVRYIAIQWVFTHHPNITILNMCLRLMLMKN